MSDQGRANTVNDTRKLNLNKEITPRILVVDDDGSILNLLSGFFTKSGYIVDTAQSSGSALEKLMDFHYNVMLLDAFMPGISGFELLKYTKKHHPLMEIIMITGNPELDAAISTVKDGAFDYIAKPFSFEKILRRVKDALVHQEEKIKESFSDSINGGCDLGDLLMKYKVVRVLGTGTSGIVFLVEKSGSEYAIKLLRRETDDEGYGTRLRRFLQEATILSKINYPNIVRVFEFGFQEHSNVPYILMEYVNGKSLVKYIKEKTLKLDEKIHIIKQLVKALAVVHEQNILHRDVKPANVLITQYLDVKLTDFGIARISDSSLTMDHEVLGSPAYMSPEMFSGKEFDQRSDIFSLGVLCYELLTGVKPFHGETVVEMMGAIQNTNPVQPNKLNPEIPLALQNIVGKMLIKKPSERFQSMNEILEVLKNIDKECNESTMQKMFYKVFSAGPKIWE